MEPVRTTEEDSVYGHLEDMSALDLLKSMNAEDRKVPLAIEKVISNIQNFIVAMVAKLTAGGRLFYIGAGTSGRMGVLDASEIPPTFGVTGLFIGLTAGGDGAIRKAVEHAEDDTGQAWQDLLSFRITAQDVVMGIAASGTTPYVLGGVKDAKAHGVLTACITCNPGSPLASVVDHPIEVVVGPEFVTGSTRLKAGTAQKLVLNMISTASMILMGKVEGNKMVDMQLTNNKLFDRGVRMIMMATEVDEVQAISLLNKHQNVRKAIHDFFDNKA